MTISKCDVCKKEMKNRDAVVTAGVGWHRFDICASCGKAVRGFLEKNNLIEKEKAGNKKK